MNQSISSILTDSILESVSSDSEEFHWDSFLHKWFRNLGTPLFFLFRRNLGVTNTQYAELFSLLELHCNRPLKQHTTRHYLFHTTEQFRSLVHENINIFLDAPADKRRDQVEAFAKIYEELFASSIIVDMFHCSCAVFLPPSVKLNLAHMVADSGYIHSAGQSVFIRDFEKCQRNYFERSIDTYLEQAPLEDLPVRFVVYAHEDFSSYDRRARAQIERGIENVKLHIDKLSMGMFRLSQIISDMREKYKDQLTIPQPGPYTEQHHFRSKKTLWLINDRSISSGDSRNPGRTRYYICYEQLVKSENPFFVFDENKPAWKSHTTLPHSLTAALLNITRSSWRNGGALCDPFGGTGTTWFEAKRLLPEVDFQCSDIDILLNQLVTDNERFFSLETCQLRELHDRLVSLTCSLEASGSKSSEVPRQGDLDFGIVDSIECDKRRYQLAKELLGELQKDQPEEEQEFVISGDAAVRLEKSDFFTRLVFYICLRAALRFGGSYAGDANTFGKAFSRSAKELIAQILEFESLHRRIDSEQLLRKDTYVGCAGRYSDVVIPSEFLWTSSHRNRKMSLEIVSMNACSLPENAFDAIICDPPYGFNTSINHLELTDLYSRFISVALNSLTSRGHLVMCLPAQSYTGRNLPLCTKCDVIVNQVLTKAEELGKEVILPGRNIPRGDFLPPYYWEADRALRRVILHFQFREIS